MQADSTYPVKRPSVVIADGHAVMALGLQVVLERQCNVVATFHDGRQLLDQISSLRPDIVVFSLALPKLSGLDVARRLHEILPATRLIAIAADPGIEFLRRALNAGVNAYLLRTVTANELLDAVAHVMNNQIYISSAFPRGAMADLENASQAGGKDRDLTERQREVLQLLAEGFSSKQIAWTLEVSVKTVDFHRARLMERLGVHNTPELVRKAMEQNLVPPTTDSRRRADKHLRPAHRSAS